MPTPEQIHRLATSNATISWIARVLNLTDPATIQTISDYRQGKINTRQLEQRLNLHPMHDFQPDITRKVPTGAGHE